MGKESIKLVANNKKAYHDYFIDEKYEAGIKPFGMEVKSIRTGRRSVEKVFVKIDRGEVYVHDMHISSYERGNIFNKDPLRVRRLLLHKYEITKLNDEIAEKGYTLVPPQVYSKGSLVKVEMGLACGKRLYDKRADIAKENQRRELEKEFKVKNLYQESEWEGITRVGRSEPGEVGEYTGFIKGAEGPKSTLRTARVAEGRQESTAEHFWRSALSARVTRRELPELDRGKVPMMCLVHDLGGRYSGDISVTLRSDADDRLNWEREDIQRICRLLPKEGAGGVSGLWEEYSQGIAPKVRLVKTLDKVETIIQYNQGRNPAGFDYAFNLDYGKKYFGRDERLEALCGLTDTETRERMEQY